MFDIEGARKAGHSNAAIASYLSQKRGFAYDDAIAAGHTPEAILGYLQPEEAEGTADRGFFGNIKDLAVSGAERVARGIPIAQSMITGDIGESTPRLMAEEAAAKRPRPPELREAEESLMRLGPEWENAEGVFQSAGAIGRMFWEVGKEAVTNPKGLAYFTAEQAANMAPAMAGMVAGAKLGILGGPLAPYTVPAGAMGGAFAGGVIVEAGLEGTGFAMQELEKRGLPPTEDNFRMILMDPTAGPEIVSKARKKAVGTAGTDAALTLLGGRIATAPGRKAFAKAAAELGAGAPKDAVSQAAARILSDSSKIGRAGYAGAGIGLNIAGEGGSEAVGQKWATGEVDMGDVAVETFAGAGMAAPEVYTAGRSLQAKKPSAVQPTPPPPVPPQAKLNDIYNELSAGDTTINAVLAAKPQLAEMGIAPEAVDAMLEEFRAVEQQVGAEKILQSANVDEAIKAATDTVERGEDISKWKKEEAALTAYQPEVPSLGPEQALNAYQPELPPLYRQGAEQDAMLEEWGRDAATLQADEDMRRLRNMRPALPAPEGKIYGEGFTATDPKPTTIRRPGKEVVGRSPEGDFVAGQEQAPKVVISRKFKTKKGAVASLEQRIRAGTLTRDYDVVPFEDGYRIENKVTGERARIKAEQARQREITDISGANPIYAAIQEARKNPLDLNSLERDYPQLAGEIGRKFPGILSRTGKVQADELAESIGMSLDEFVETLKATPTKGAEAAKIEAQQPDLSDVDELVKKGYEPTLDIQGRPTTMTAGELNTGDEVRAEVAGRESDDYKVTRNPDGTITLKDGEVLTVDDFDQLRAEGIKKEANPGALEIPPALARKIEAGEPLTALEKGMRDALKAEYDKRGLVFPIKGKAQSRAQKAPETAQTTAEIDSKTQFDAPIKPDENINGVTRRTFGEIVKEGNVAEAVKHVEEGLADHGPRKMQDAVRNEIMRVVANTPKVEREALRTRIKPVEDAVNAVMNKTPAASDASALSGVTSPPAVSTQGAGPARSEAPASLPADIRPPSENLSRVVSSTYESGRVVGDETVTAPSETARPASETGEPVKQASNKETTPKQEDAAQAAPASDAGSSKSASEMTAAELLRAAADKMEGKKPAPAEKIEEAKTALAAHDETMKRVHAGDATLAEYKAAFQRVVDGKQELTAELSAMTKQQLLDRMGGTFAYSYKNENKDRIVRAAYQDMLTDFWVKREMFSYGMDGILPAIKKAVEATTEADLAAHAKALKDARAERKAKAAEAMEAVKDPKTMEDFRTYFAVKLRDGTSFRDVYMGLTPEQRATYDDLASTETRSRRKDTAESRRDVQAAAVQTTGEIIATKHTKTGADLFVVQAGERVERDVYKQWNATAKKLGGWYSSYRAGGAVPGFQFKAKENAEAFKAYLAGETGQAQEVAKERRDAFADDRSQTAAERLNEMADRLEARADEVLAADRKVNTSRRAQMANRAEANANADKALAKTMRNLAAHDGKLQVRQKVQVEELARAVKMANYAEGRAKHPNDYGKQQATKVTADTASYAEFPTFTANRSDLAKLGRILNEQDGTKKLGARLLKVADDVTAEYLKFAKENTHLVATFTKKDGTRAVFANKADAEIALSRSGFRGKAVVLPVKRGENLLIMSPALAKERGAWKGDDDKRITISPELGMEIVEKSKDAPWQFQRVKEELTRLRSMNIETPAELRAALREFIALQEAPAAPSKVKELEREMVGRVKDGLDFFPTPADVAQEMVEAADIQEGMTVLEPSAGMGHIAEQIREAGVEPDVVEMSGKRRELLEAKGFNVVGQDFLDTTEKYDRIVMNPPFSDRRDAAHVQHAYSLLKPNGRVVAIMGEGVFFGQDKKAEAFREWLDSVGGTSEKLAEGTFQDPSLPVNTAVNARLVVIDKQTGTDALLSMRDRKSLKLTSTVEATRAELTAKLGEKAITRLESRGKLKIFRTEAAALDFLDGNSATVEFVGDHAPSDTHDARRAGQRTTLAQKHYRRLHTPRGTGDAGLFGDAGRVGSPKGKSATDTARSDADLIADTVEAPSFVAEGFSGLEVPSQIKVLAAVSRAVKNNEVFDSVVELIPVDVMNMLQEQEFSPEVFLHDMAVRENALAMFEGRGDIVVPVDGDSSSLTATVREVARATAEVQSRQDFGRVSGEKPAAMGAATDSSHRDMIARRAGRGNRKVAGFFDPKTKTVALVSDNIEQGAAWSVLLHEASHAILDADGIYANRRDKIISDFSRLREVSTRVKAAYGMVPAGTPALHVDSEALAYYIQQEANKTQPLYKRIIGAIKMALMRWGMPVGRLSESDFVSIFTAGARRWAKAETVGEQATGSMAPALFSKIHQAFGSAATSLPQVARVFKMPWFGKAGGVNIDIGGGRFDHGTDHLKGRGIENIVYDPYNRPQADNESVVQRLKDGLRGDTVTANNVLNVIRERDVRVEVVKQAAKAVKPDGTAYFMIHEGSDRADGKKAGDGVGVETSKGWQNYRKAAEYVPEVQEHFGEVERKGNIIVAKGPRNIEGPAMWRTDAAGESAISFARTADLSATDRKYLDLAKDPEKNQVALQKMVDEEAREAGYTEGPFWHGSPDFHGNEFDPGRRGSNTGFSRGGFSFTDNRAAAEAYAAPQGEGEATITEMAVAFNKVSGDLTVALRKDQALGEAYESEMPGASADEAAELRPGNLDDISDAVAMAEEHAEFARRHGLKDIAGRYDQVARMESREASPRVMRVFLESPRVETDRDGRKVWLADRPEQVKLADAVVRDDQGNIIPLSQRFNPAESDIRFTVSEPSDIYKELGFRRHNGHQPLANRLGKIIGKQVTAWRLPDAVYRQDRKGRVDSRGNPYGEHEAAGRLADIFKKQLIWAEIGETAGINGVVVLRNKMLRDTIFVDVRADKPAHVVFGHELSHHLEQDAPDLFQMVYDSIEPLIVNTEHYREAGRLEGVALKKEIVGDALGDNFNNPEFWGMVEDHAGASKFKKLARKVLSWINSFFTSESDFGSSSFLSDVEGARNILAFATAEYMADRRGTPTWADDSTPLFAMAPDPKVQAEADKLIRKLKSRQPPDLARMVEKYDELKAVLNSTTEDIYSKQKLIEEHAKKMLPPAERFRVMHVIKHVAQRKTPAGREASLAHAIERIVEAHQRVEEKARWAALEKDTKESRRSRIVAIRDYLGLTDNDLRKISQKDVRLMTDFEFKKFKDDLYDKAVAFAEHRQKKNEVLEIIYSKKLNKVENLQRAMNLPTIDKMNNEQLQMFGDILSQYQYDDTFMGKRSLQTVDNNDYLRGIRTWREAIEKAAEELGVPSDKLLEAVKKKDSDFFRWDTALADRNPLFRRMVEEVTGEILAGEARSLKVQEEVMRLARLSNKSRRRKLVDYFVPQEEQIFDYIQAKDEDKAGIAAGMTPEQLDLAHAMREYLDDVREQLIARKVMDIGLDNYFTHSRRSFFETWRDDGITVAIKNIFINQEQDEAIFTIMDNKTNMILPREKFFANAMHRTGGLVPSKNVIRVFLNYSKAWEKKKAFDTILSKYAIYADALTPPETTKGGLLKNTKLNDFIYAWLNNKKGRKVSLDGMLPQGGKLDSTIRGLRMFTTLIDLGLNIPTGLAAMVGEQTANFAMLGTKAYALGTARMRTSKGQKILAAHKEFTGRSVWEEFTDPGKEFTERLNIGLFGLFHTSTVAANKQFLLGSLSDAEWNSGQISKDRLAELRVSMGRLRMVPGTKSIAGSTSIGGVFTQYKTWAVPILSTTVKDIKKLAGDIKNKPVGEALTTREAREVIRIVGVSSTALIVIMMMGEADDDDFLGQVKAKVQRESTTLMQGIDPGLWLSRPRVITFLDQLGRNINSLLKLEEYKTKDGLKGLGGLQRQFTPSLVRTIARELND